MNTVEMAASLIKRFEGLHKLGKDRMVRPYTCPAGVLTVGWGTTKFDKTRQSFTIHECEEMLYVELEYILRKLAGMPASESRMAAIASWVYNLGIGAFRTSTMRKRILAQDWEGAARECEKWVWGGGRKLPGLVLRRAVEAEMLRKG